MPLQERSMGDSPVLGLYGWPLSLSHHYPQQGVALKDSCKGMLAESGSRQLPLVSPGQGTVVMAW